MRIDGLSDFQKDLIRTSEKLPKEMPDILRKVGTKGKAHVAKKAKSMVKKKTGNYQKKWKRGKVFKGREGDLVTRIINSSSHAHLIEDGHRMVGKNGNDLGVFVPGKHVLKKGTEEFENSGVPEKMFSDWLDKKLSENKL